MLSAWFWMRVLSVQQFAQLKYLLTLREFFIEDLIQLINLPGLYHIAVLLLSCTLIIAWYLKSRTDRVAVEQKIGHIALALTAVILVFEIPPIGRFLLIRVPAIDLIQGTWRLYILVLLLGCSFIAIAQTRPARNIARTIALLYTIAAIPLAVLAAGNLHLFPHSPERATDPPEYAPIYTLHSNSELESTFATHVNDPVMIRNSTTVTYHRFYWPLRHAYDGDVELPTWPDTLGRAISRIPQHTPLWKLEQTPFERAGLWVSGIAWSLILFWSVWLFFSRRKSPVIT
jgi:hypothetical protein